MSVVVYQNRRCVVEEVGGFFILKSKFKGKLRELAKVGQKEAKLFLVVK